MGSSSTRHQRTDSDRTIAAVPNLRLTHKPGTGVADRGIKLRLPDMNEPPLADAILKRCTPLADILVRQLHELDTSRKQIRLQRQRLTRRQRNLDNVLRPRQLQQRRNQPSHATLRLHQQQRLTAHTATSHTDRRMLTIRVNVQHHRSTGRSRRITIQQVTPRPHVNQIARHLRVTPPSSHGGAMEPPAGLLERGSALWLALGVELDSAAGAVALEACRTVDRLDALDRVIAADPTDLAPLVEARQQGTALRNLLLVLGIDRAPASPVEDVSPLAQVLALVSGAKPSGGSA